MSVQVHYKLQTFEGPLDLLLHLIEKAEVDIYDIPVSEITDQYMEYVASMQELELDVASEFLVMAATLLSIKSKMLLPKPPVVDIGFEDDEELDLRAELVQKLLEYRKYKEIAEHLREKELERSLIYSREASDLSPFLPETAPNPVLGLHVADLVLAFQRVLRRSASRDRITRVRRDEVSVKERIEQVLHLLRGRGGQVLFSQLFTEEMTREEIVVSFLAVLELMKMKRVTCFQHRSFEDIVIRYREKEEQDDGLSEYEVDY